jgi:hypothetical protein
MHTARSLRVFAFAAIGAGGLFGLALVPGARRSYHVVSGPAANSLQTLQR